MAKTPVRLEVEGFQKREVQMVSYAFNQAIDKENQPAGIPRGGLVTIKCKALNGSDGLGELLNWMTSKTMAKNGKVIFMVSSDSEKLLKELEFEQAYCVQFKEVWEDKQSNADLAHYEEIVISCRKIKCAGAEYRNEWA